MSSVTIAQIIAAIEQRQPVLNKEILSEPQLHQCLQSVASLSAASDDQLSFLADARYTDALLSSQAGAIIVAPAQADKLDGDKLVLVTKNPYLAYASASQLFEALNNKSIASQNNGKASSKLSLSQETIIHPTALVADSAQIGQGVHIGAYCVIGDDVIIGDGCHLASHVVLEDGVILGAECLLNSQVVIAHHCKLGRSVRVHAHASIGSEGFGFAPSSNPAELGWERIAQLGTVIIGDNVRIGSQTCIDRGAIADTLIEDNVIIDNQVQIAHNVTIGAGSAIAANTGIAGSTKIGKRCMIGGAVGISGHLSITDDVTITGRTLVTKSINQSGSYSSGTVAMPSADWRRAAVRFRQMGKKQMGKE